jgi:hypothetical protein
VTSPDQLRHGTFAENPQIVQLIGQAVARGQVLTDSKVGLGERIAQTTAGAAASVGHAAGLIVSAPVAIIDPDTREHYGDQIDAFGHSVEDAAKAARTMILSLSFGHKSCRAPGSPAGEARQQHSHYPGNEYSVKCAGAAD